MVQPQILNPPKGTRRAARWRGFAANLLLTIGATIAALLLLELALRATGWSPERHRIRIRLSSHGDLRVRESGYELDCYPSNPQGAFPVDLRRPEVRQHYRELGFRSFVPALPDSPWCIEFRFNSLGVRGPEYGPRRPGVKRIVVVGDSFTEGQGVRENELYTSILGMRLAAEAPGRYEVLNFGQRALDIAELFKAFERALDLAPDLVVYGLCLNDADRSPAFDRRWPRLNDWIMVRRPPVLLKLWDSRLAALLDERLEQRRIARDTTRWYLDMYGDANRDGWNRTKEYLRRMKTAMDERHGQLLVAIWPLLVDLDRDYPFREVHERLGRACDRAGIAHYDLLAALAGRPNASLWAHPADRHPNGLAHRLAAESLVPVVRRMLEAGPLPTATVQ